jgi:preprotein translocase subunit Sss1
MTDLETMKRVDTRWDGLQDVQPFKTVAKVVAIRQRKISDLESDRRIANLLDKPKWFESSVMVVAAFGFLVIDWFAWMTK